MQFKSAVFSATALAALWSLIAPSSTYAGIMYWDNDASGAGNVAPGGLNSTTVGTNLGNAGTWDTSSSKWWDGASGSDTTWTSGGSNTNTAWFAGATAGTVATAASSNISAGGLTFTTNAYTLNRGLSATLTLVSPGAGAAPILAIGASSILGTTTATTTINAPLSGVDGLAISGSSPAGSASPLALTLSGQSTYTGPTSITRDPAGTGTGTFTVTLGGATTSTNILPATTLLTLNQDTKLLINYLSGATLTNSQTITGLISGTVDAGHVAPSISSTNGATASALIINIPNAGDTYTYAGTIDGGTNRTLVLVKDGPGTQIINGIISGLKSDGVSTGGYTHSITVVNGTLQLGAINSITQNGITAVTGGTLYLASGAAISTTANLLPNVTVSGGANLKLAPAAGAGTGIIGKITSATSNGPALTMQNASTLDFREGTVGNFTVAGPVTALSMTTTTLYFDVSDTTADKLVLGNGTTDPAGTGNGGTLLSGINTININPISGSLTVGDTYTLISAGSGLATGGSFTLGTPTVTVGAFTYTLSLTNAATFEKLNIVSKVAATPEPTSLGLLTLGSLALLARRRRKSS